MRFPFKADCVLLKTDPLITSLKLLSKAYCILHKSDPLPPIFSNITIQSCLCPPQTYSILNCPELPARSSRLCPPQNWPPPLFLLLPFKVNSFLHKTDPFLFLILPFKVNSFLHKTDPSFFFYYLSKLTVSSTKLVPSSLSS